VIDQTLGAILSHLYALTVQLQEAQAKVVDLTDELAQIKRNEAK